MSLKRVAIALFAGLLFCADNAGAAERDLVIGVEELDYFPAYAVRGGSYVGAAREIFDAFAHDLGYEVVYRPLPIKRLFAEMLSGGIDLKFPDNPQWVTDLKQGKSVVYSKPVIDFIDGVMVRSDNMGRPADSIGILGTVSGFTPIAWMEQIKKGKVQVRENPRMDLLLKQVAMGRVDGAYVSVAVANSFLDGDPAMTGVLRFDPGLPHSRDHYHASSLSRPEVVAAFDDWLEKNQARVKAIKDRTGAEKGLN